MTFTADRALQDALVARFLRYSAVTSQSDASASVVPTSEGQRELAELLAGELREAGAADVHVSPTAVVTAHIPAKLPAGHDEVAPLGFCAHLDTVDVALSPEVHARVVDYPGGDVCLNEDAGSWITLAEHPELGQYAGDRLLVADGTSVLGADDKAGLAVVMELVTRLLAGVESVHGDVYVAFVPDEEIGLRGVRTLELDRFPVAYAYTVDGGALGEIVHETFNAAHAVITIQGVAAHPMSAKGVLVNPILLAHDLIARFDRAQTPECTEGREGFIWVDDIRGNQSSATLEINIRDHDLAGFEAKKRTVADAVEAVAAANPRAALSVTIEDVYANINDAVTDANRGAIDHAFAALDALGIERTSPAMRGGTDGSYLSRQGILTPNLFTGAHNFHSTAEFLPLRSFQASYAVCRAIVERVVASD